MALQFRIQLKHISKPPVWRRLLIPDSFTFRQFHYAIQLAFDWATEHLYQFQKQAYDNNWCIGEPEEDGMMSFFSNPTMPAKKIKVKKFLEEHLINKFVYVYDFGDDWIHEIVLEDINTDRIKHPVCLDGKGATPPENCGGPYRYEWLKSIMANPTPTNEEMAQLTWAFEEYSMDNGVEDENGILQYEDPEDVGWKQFDIKAVDLEDINYGLENFASYEKDFDEMYDDGMDN